MGKTINKVKIVSIFLVCLMMINSIVLVFAGVPGVATTLETNSEEILIDDFSQFVKRQVIGNVSVVQTSDVLSFSNNNLSVPQAYLSFGLPFDSFGNITDVSVSFDVHYLCSNSTGRFMFSGWLGTFFHSSSEEYDSSERNLVDCGIDKYFHYGGFSAELFFGDEKNDFDYFFPLENTLTFTITKTRRTIVASISAENGTELFSFERNHPHIYAYASSFSFWYSAFQDTQFTVDISSLNVNLLVEQRDWAAEARSDQIAKAFVILLICLLVLSLIVTGVFFILHSPKYREREEKRLRREERANLEKNRKLGD